MKKKSIGKAKSRRRAKNNRGQRNMKKLLALAGAWEDDRTVEEQIRDIHRSRKNRS